MNGMVRIWKELFLTFFKVLRQLWLRESETSQGKLYSRKLVAQCKIETSATENTFSGAADTFSGAADNSHCSLKVQIKG